MAGSKNWNVTANVIFVMRDALALAVVVIFCELRCCFTLVVFVALVLTRALPLPLPLCCCGSRMHPSCTVPFLPRTGPLSCTYLATLRASFLASTGTVSFLGVGPSPSHALLGLGSVGVCAVKHPSHYVR